MGRYFLYFATGTKYAARLMVSLASLRKHHPGDPVVIMGPEAFGSSVARHLATSDPLVHYVQFPMVQLKRNSAYYAKTYLHRHAPEGHFIFLDADTLVVDRLDDLWSDGIILTQFANWITTGPMISGRIRKWETTAPKLTQRMLASPYPAVNTGVFSGHTGHPFLEAWTELCRKNPIFICDEIAAQLIYPDFDHAILNDRWNCSPKHGINRQEAKIWHGHGESFQKVGFPPWIDQFVQCVNENYAGCKSWLGEYLLPMERDILKQEGVI